MKLFDSKWPIVEAAMNNASDKTLALAVSQAGGFPSLCTYPKYTIKPRNPNSPLPHKDIDFDPMFYEISDFILSNGSANVIVPVPPEWLLHADFLKIAKEVKISHWEIFPRWQNEQICCSKIIMDDLIFGCIKQLKKYSKVIGRLLGPVSNNPRLEIFDGLAIKGSDSGGGRGYFTVQETFNHQIQHSKNVIPYGGVGTPQQVRAYIDQGAPAVAVGTLFAACLESPLTMEAKLQMVTKTSKDITKIKGDPDGKIQQNALLLDPALAVDGSNYTHNHSDQLLDGIYGNGHQGILFAGSGIDHVDKVRTVQETMEYLVSELH